MIHQEGTDGGDLPLRRITFNPDDISAARSAFENGQSDHSEPSSAPPLDSSSRRATPDLLEGAHLPGLDSFQIADNRLNPGYQTKGVANDTGESTHIGLTHALVRSACHGFNTFAIACSELVFTGHAVGRAACVGCTGFGWLIPSQVYSQFPLFGIFVAGGALSGAIVASSVNRSIHYNPLLIGEDGIAKHVKEQGLTRFRESLSIAGLVAGPASFWASVSPVLTQARQSVMDYLKGTDAASSAALQFVDYAAGRIEHMVPFLLIGVLTTMKLVNRNPERFITSMSPTAGMLSRPFSWWAGLRELVGKEFTDEPGKNK